MVLHFMTVTEFHAAPLHLSIGIFMFLNIQIYTAQRATAWVMPGRDLDPAVCLYLRFRLRYVNFVFYQNTCELCWC